MATTITLDRNVFNGMKAIILYCDDRGLTEGMDTKAKEIRSRLWNVYNDLDEARTVDENTVEVEVYESSAEDFNEVLTMSFIGLDEDDAYRRMVCHSLFVHDCVESVRSELVRLQHEAKWDTTSIAGAIKSLDDKGEAYRMVCGTAEHAVITWESEGVFDNLVDTIISMDW